MKKQTRRKFVTTVGAGSLYTIAASGAPLYLNGNGSGKLALLGGEPVRRSKFPIWPIWDSNDEKAIIPVLRSGVWSRRDVTSETEKKFAEIMGSKYCLFTTNGTNALITSLRIMGVEGGDEVITTPWSFIASIDAIMINNALPVFVDIDPETWMMNADQIEGQINQNTRAILAVQILGGICDMDKVNGIAKKHNLKVVEDACEAHLAEWRGKKVGTLGDLGCFSLQNGKQITCGEGGAILGDDKDIMDMCYSFHSYGVPRGNMPKDKGVSILGTKCRISEYQSSIVNTQLDTSVSEAKTRAENASYLTSKLKDIPGIVPRKDYEGTNFTSYYFYGLRFKEEEFGFSRRTFLRALSKEGIPADPNLGVCSRPLYENGVIETVTNSRTYQKLFSKKRIEEYRASLSLPEVTKLCKESVGFKHNMLLGTKSDMDDIYNAVAKVYENRNELKNYKA